MPVIDDIRLERKKIKNKTLRQKASYLWTYYKVYFIVLILIAALISSYVIKGKTPKIILSGVMLNVFVKTEQTSPEETISKKFQEFCKYDPQKKRIELNTSLFYVANTKTETYENYNTMQVLITKTAVGKLDFMTGDRETMLELAYNNFFYDLREVLSEKQIEKYKPYILYADKSVIDRLAEGKSIEKSSQLDIPDCRSPDKMIEPIPILIDISESPIITETYNYSNDTISFGVSGNHNMQMVGSFLDFVISQ